MQIYPKLMHITALFKPFTYLKYPKEKQFLCPFTQFMKYLPVI